MYRSIHLSISLSVCVLAFPPPSLPKDVYSLLAVDPVVSWCCGNHNSPSNDRKSWPHRLLEEFSCFHIHPNFAKKNW